MEVMEAKVFGAVRWKVGVERKFETNGKKYDFLLIYIYLYSY